MQAFHPMLLGIGLKLQVSPSVKSQVTNLVCSTYLKTLDTFGNCQRTVFALGVSQHMHTKTYL